MVERTKSTGFEEFEGLVESVLPEPSSIDDGEQYHLIIKPLNVEVTGKTGMMHEWIRIPPKATSESVPEGSILDKYIQELEILNSGVKKCVSHLDAMSFLVSKKFLFKKKKLGKAFDGKEAKGYWTPVKEL